MAELNEKTLAFHVDESSDLPLWVQLKNRLAYLISSGYYEPGEQLPTVRALAADISINYNTVNKAYLALKSEGYIESTRGRGAFVRDLDVEVDEAFSEEVDTILTDCIVSCRDLGMSLDDVRTCMDAKITQVKRAEGLEDTPVAEGRGRIVTIELGGKALTRQAGA